MAEPKALFPEFSDRPGDGAPFTTQPTLYMQNILSYTRSEENDHLPKGLPLAGIASQS